MSATSVTPLTGRFDGVRHPRRRSVGCCSDRRAGWVLLETVIATGMLIVGLAVIGAQVQSADTSIRKMRRRIRAMSLAETQLAWLDMGLVKLDSFDEVEERDFGPRFPDFGWRLTTEPSGAEAFSVLKLEVLFRRREGPYRPDDFEYDVAETVHTLYTVRAAPQPLNLADDFGLDDQEMEELSTKLEALGIEGLSADALDPTILAKLNFEEFMKALPLIAEAFGIDLETITANLPPELMDLLERSGALDTEGDSASDQGASSDQNAEPDPGETGP